MATDTQTEHVPGLPTERWDLERLLEHLVLGTTVFLMAVPILIAALVSTQETAIIDGWSGLLPGSAGQIRENYATTLFDYRFATFVANSLVMSVVVVVGKLAFSLLAALAIVYYDFRFENLAFAFVLFTLMLPVPVRFVPLFNVVTDLGWYDSLLALTVPYLASATTVFLLRQHFLGIPTSIVETARLDGVGPLRFLVHVLIPMSRGAIAGIAVIMFVYAWNQYLWPLVIVTSESQQVTQVGITLLQGDVQSGELQWAIVMAGTMLTLLPPLLALLAFRKPLLETFGVQS